MKISEDERIAELYYDEYIRNALNHGPCMGCENCMDIYLVPIGQMNSYKKRHNIKNVGIPLFDEKDNHPTVILEVL